MLKILQVVGGMDVGGTETMLMNIYRELKDDVQFDFISYYDYEGYYDKEIESLGGSVIRLNNPNKIGRIKGIVELKTIIKENNYDAVHVHTLFNSGIGILASYIGNSKIRVCHSHTNSEGKDSFIRKVYKSFMRKIINIFSTKLLACSESAGEYLFGEKIIYSKNFKVIPNYIDYKKILEYRGKQVLRDELKLQKEDILIGNIGRFIKSKNQRFLLELLKEFKDQRYKLILVGEGELKNELERKCSSLGISSRVYFLGIRDDIAKIINSLDLFIMPSLYEGLGLVLLEAQAGGIPCLCSKEIQNEADLNLGLMKKISLDEDLKVWKEEVERGVIERKKPSKEEVEEAFFKKGYSIELIKEELLKVYKGGQV